MLQQHFDTLVADNARWQTSLADEIVWELPYAPALGHPERLLGREAVVRHVTWFLGVVDQALALAEQRGMRPLIAHCHLGLGKLYQRTGKRPEAQDNLTTAAMMYREMAMRFWLEKAKASGSEGIIGCHQESPPSSSPPFLERRDAADGIQ